MNQKSIDSSANGCLILILPISLVIVFLFTTWPVLLGLVALSFGFNSWQQHQWQQWSQQVNPVFHQVIQANQGRITTLDLAMKANFSAATAKRYLDSKAEEFGAQRQDYEDVGTVYYFITSGTLGSMFDKSEPPSELEPQEEKTEEVVSKALEPRPSQMLGERPKDEKSKDVEPIATQTVEESVKDESDSVLQVIAPEAETSTDSAINPPSTIPDVAYADLKQAEPVNQKHSVPQSLIQSELAKRLNVYSSTVYKRRNDPDFDEWSRNRDPDGIAWKFSPKTKEFSPV